MIHSEHCFNCGCDLQGEDPDPENTGAMEGLFEDFRGAEPRRRFLKLTSIEFCAGGGGQALGVERAGYRHLRVVEWDNHAYQTLMDNRGKEWRPSREDMRFFKGLPFRRKVNLFAAGVPCPPFTDAGKQEGKDDERDLFPSALRLIDQIQPDAVMLENVRGFLRPKFEAYRESIFDKLKAFGYVPEAKLLEARDFGVPQLRPRAVIVALRPAAFARLDWAVPEDVVPVTVGESLYPLMVERGWKGADEWKLLADRVAPTLVGGSKKHGGPDLGPTRAKRQWAEMGVDGKVLANEPPAGDFEGMPRLTVRMCARLQGFPIGDTPDQDLWRFSGKKTNAYRQVGNAFPPPVAEHVARQIRLAILPDVMKAAGQETPRIQDQFEPPQ